MSACDPKDVLTYESVQANVSPSSTGGKSQSSLSLRHSPASRTTFSLGDSVLRQRNAQYCLPSLSHAAGNDSGSERVAKYLKALAAQHRCLRELFRKIHRASPSTLCSSDATAPKLITLQGLQDAALSGEISLPITSAERLLELACTCIVRKQPQGPSEKAGYVRTATEETRYVSTKDLMHKVNSDAMRVFKGDVSAEFVPGATYMDRIRTDASMPSGTGKTSRVKAMIDSTIGVSRSSALGSLGKKFSNRSGLGVVRFIGDASLLEKSKQVEYEPEALAKAWAKMRGMYLSNRLLHVCACY